ncbi:MAG: hypothetical protein JEY91_09615 [Spirochaetaceae bacterium]|nr:hypothetical protein [Spirochaetaceae bacterium]
MNTMKHTTLILISLFFILSCATKNELISTVTEQRLESFSVSDGSGNLIQSVSIIYNDLNKPSEIQANSTEGDLLNRTTMEYTESGKLATIKNSSDELKYIKTEYHYDDSDFLVKVLSKNETESILGSSTYINDEKGNPVEWMSQYRRGNEKIHFIMEYDDQGQLIKTSELDEKEETIYYSVSQYDESGNEISYTIYSPEGQIDQQLLSFYRENVLSRTEIRDETGLILYKTVYELNEWKKPSRITSYNQYEDINDYVEITYDERGNEHIRKSFDHEGNLQEKIVKEYDSENNNREMTIYDEKDKIVSVTRNVFVNKPLNMTEEEFNALVFTF